MLSFRFGIEMVPLDQEDQSQEEDAIPLLEGFHWDSLIDMSASGASRKRSLSESSLATASSRSVFTSLMSQETPQKEGLSAEQQGPSVSENNDSRPTQELEQMSGQHEAKAEKQPDSLTTATALQQSGPVLVDSSSETEQYDGQGTGKRRRAARVSEEELDRFSCRQLQLGSIICGLNLQQINKSVESLV